VKKGGAKRVPWQELRGALFSRNLKSRPEKRRIGCFHGEGTGTLPEALNRTPYELEPEGKKNRGRTSKDVGISLL